MMKQAWLKFKDMEFHTETAKKFVQMREYEEPMQRDIFELIDKAMLDHRLQKVDPKKVYHRHLGELIERLCKKHQRQKIKDI